MTKNMEILWRLGDEELAVLVEIIVDKGWQTEELTLNSRFRACKEIGDYRPCRALIASEIRKFGGNSIANFFRGGEGPEYKEIACDVCEKFDIKASEDCRMRDIDRALLEKVLSEMWSGMSCDERKKLLSSLHVNIGTDSDFLAEGCAALIVAFRAGGFASYQLTVAIVNAIAQAIVGRGLSLAANAALTKAVSIAVGPIGVALNALWLIKDITGPAYRVTVPIVIYLAAMRELYRFKPEDAEARNIAYSD